MIIDDDPEVNNLMKEYLEASDYRSVSVFDGMQAVQIARTRKPDLILLDLNLPAGGGEMVYSRLKLMKFTESLPVLFVTGEAPGRLEKLAAKKGVNKEDIFTKPVDFGLLLEKIKNVLSEKEQ